MLYLDSRARARLFLESRNLAVAEHLDAFLSARAVQQRIQGAIFRRPSHSGLGDISIVADSAEAVRERAHQNLIALFR